MVVKDITRVCFTGRRSPEEITFFKSVGLAAQDAVAASAVLEEAEKRDLGRVIDMSGR